MGMLEGSSSSVFVLTAQRDCGAEMHTQLSIAEEWPGFCGEW